MKQILLFFVSIIAFMSVIAQDNEHYLLIGTYTANGKSEGVYVYKFNSETGDATPVSAVATNNPSFVAISPDEKFVYAIHEIEKGGMGGEISSFSFDKKTGVLTLINTQPTRGDHPAYVEVDNTGKWVFAGNYTSGSLSVFGVDKDGSLKQASTIQHTGSSKDPKRQTSPHVHCTKISPDNHWLFVPDLGIDKVMIYSFNPKTGELKPGKQPFSAAEPGTGPRHFTFHPNNRYAYLIEEMGGYVVAYQYNSNSGELKEIQRISTKPTGKEGFAGSADIHVSADGRFLYATNRGDFNSIAAYTIDPATGKLTVLENVSTQGKGPRNFNIDPSGNFILVANQSSNDIVIFKRDQKTGLLTDTGKRIQVPEPVCLKWARVK